ncbi:four helix bundle protein [Olivibacter domesticus]|uniref:Four helix bundle protein n=1 Tax=Olivibacter domesticus TaxID=407022 RepID=A0A1H7XSC9_OLID1|nr:four helix bundle protein [Olivibacter domesticus]SEM36690.1 four helix bundle protein [Olivibacter domesticus]
MKENIKSYTELEVWKKARELVKEIYLTTANYPQDEVFGLVNQMRRCAVSVPSNIAEGCGRNHTKDSIQFFFIGRGSLYELETQIHLSSDLNFINKEELEKLLSQLLHARKLLNGFIRYYQQLKDKEQ